MRMRHLIPSLMVTLATAFLLAAQQANPPRKPQIPAPEVPAKEKPANQVPAKDVPATLDDISGELTYTTYFYTAAEAIIHGFENDTKVRIISMEKKGTV